MTCRCHERGRFLAPLVESGIQAELANAGGRQDSELPRANASSANGERRAVERAIRAGDRAENSLTDLVFYSRHPERNRRPLSRSEAGFASLSREWLQIRDGLVRPALQGGSRTKTPAGAPDIVSVRGIQVARTLAGQLEALLAAAEADGIRLGGSGYRSPQRQIELRRAHCGTSDYAVYQMPSSQCTPPTARPGSSMHEQGLAIDFTHNGRSIRTHDDPGFRWLAANASRYGLFNLPSEAWHWSVNGK